MGLANRCRQLARTHPLASDILVAFGCFATAAYTPELFSQSAYEKPTAMGVLFGALACALLVLRRHWPLSVLAGTSGLALVCITVDGADTPFILAAACAAYTLTSTLSGNGVRTALPCALVAVAAGTAALLTPEGTWTETFNIGIGIGFAAELGHVVRNKREQVAEMAERARRAEHTREEEARRRVAEERLRIARELHDVVGHHIALINVQSTVAMHVLEDQPDQARQALTHVRQASRTVLDEISLLLGVLRDSGEAAPTEPVPSLARLDNLLASFRSAGMPVELLGGEPRTTLPTAVDLAAYRVIQESLTNVYKHAGRAAATVELTTSPGELRVAVRNLSGSGALPTTGGSGRGIAGMRERACSVGGRLAAGPLPGGGFLVSAVLPHPEGEQGDDSRAAGGRPGADPRRVPCADRVRAGSVGGG